MQALCKGVQGMQSALMNITCVYIHVCICVYQAHLRAPSIGVLKIREQKTWLWWYLFGATGSQGAGGRGGSMFEARPPQLPLFAGVQIHGWLRRTASTVGAVWKWLYIWLVRKEKHEIWHVNRVEASTGECCRFWSIAPAGIHAQGHQVTVSMMDASYEMASQGLYVDVSMYARTYCMHTHMHVCSEIEKVGEWET